jgi:hypothetical protein
MLRQISLGKVGLVVGGILAVMGFIAYGVQNSTLNLIGFFYGIPILLGGLALTASELTPVPLTKLTAPEVLTLREQQATDTQNQIRSDVTRYRYGQRAHLDESLDRLGLSPTDEERPVLTGLYEKNWDGNYALVMQFFSPLISLDTWKEKQDKIARFFGPGLRVELMELEEEQIEVALIVTPQA